MPPLNVISPSVSLSHLAPRLDLYLAPLGWVSEPKVNTRGTWDILQACIVTIFFCTATSLHLNIPKEEYGNFRRMWTHFWWMTANAVAPEVCMCIAMTQYIEARLVLKDIKRLCNKRPRRKDRHWTMTHAFYYNMRGFVYRPSASSNYNSSSSQEYNEPKPLKMKHLDAIIELDLLKKITLPESLIKEYSKQNRLAKTIAVVQALWLLIQTFARIREHLPASPFEITAVAYIAITLFSWALWFNKPQDVGFSTELRGDVWAEVIDITRDRPDRPTEHGPDITGWKNQLPNVNRRYRVRDYIYLGSTWLFTASVFGGLHLLAWNYEFPTQQEKLLWRVSSVAIMALPPAFYFWETLRFLAGRKTSLDPIGRALVMLYITARAYNFFEVLFSLRSTPPALYQTVQWTTFLPHF